MADSVALVGSSAWNSRFPSSEEDQSSPRSKRPSSASQGPAVRTSDRAPSSSSTTASGFTATTKSNTTTPRTPVSRHDKGDSISTFSDVDFASSSSEEDPPLPETGDPDKGAVTTNPASHSQAIVPTSSRPTYRVENISKAERKLLEAKQREVMRNNAALIAATKTGNISTVKQLIHNGDDVNRPDPEGFTALHHAARSGNQHLAAELIDAQAERNAKTKEGYTPMMLAALERHPDMVGLLARYDSTTRKPDPTEIHTEVLSLAAKSEIERLDAFRLAVKGNDITMAARLIAGGNMPLNESDETDKTPLMLAAAGGHVEMIRLLICNGAGTGVSDENGNTALMHAAAAREIPAIDALLEAGANAVQANIHERSALGIAVDNDDTDVLDALLGKKYSGGKLHTHMPALICAAAEAGKQQTVRMLIEKGADLPDDCGSLALAVMAKKNELQAVRTLLAAGACPHHRAWDGHTAFTLAAANGHESIVKALFAHCPTGFSQETWTSRFQDETDRDGRTALMLAVLNRQYDMADLLLTHGADPHKVDGKGRNAILWAAAKGDKDMATLLLDYHATHIAKDRQENTVFLAAAKHGNKKVLQMFCRPYYKNSMVNLDTPNKDGDTPLIVAAKNGHRDVVEFLLDNGANLLHHNNSGLTALLEAAAHGHRDVLAILQVRESKLPMVYPVMDMVIRKIVEIIPVASHILPGLQRAQSRQFDEQGNTMVHLLASNGHVELLGELLPPTATQMQMQMQPPRNASSLLSDRRMPMQPLSKSNALALEPANPDIEISNKEGMTPLCAAVRNGYYSTVKLMVEQGARVNHVTFSGITPLWLACRLKKCADEQTPDANPDELVELLLAYGAAPNQASIHGQTPLIAASATGISKVVERLIKAGADVNQGDAHGLTPLMYASHHGHTAVAAMLMDAGAAPDPAPGTLSALILAAESGKDDMVRMLVKRGANTNHVDESGATALISASAAGHLSTVNLLKKNGANLKVRNKSGNDAMYYAQRKEHYAVLATLRDGYPEARDC